MSFSSISGVRIAGVGTCAPTTVVDNASCGGLYGDETVRKVVSMAGVKSRRIAGQGVTAADLCFEAAAALLDRLGWARESITGLIFVSQSGDYLMPSTACLLHKWLGLSTDCAAFDVGLGCSGYPYGLYLAATMLNGGGQQRILMLNGETPSRFVSPDDHTTALLFGDAGSATAIERSPESGAMAFGLHTDGTGYDRLIIAGGGFRDRFPANERDLHVFMDGGSVFNFTVKRVPELVHDTLARAGRQAAEVDWYFFHQANRFIIRHIAKKCGIPEAKVPMPLEAFGNCGGPSVALALTQALSNQPPQGMTCALMLGYGVGLSWASALVNLDQDLVALHLDYGGEVSRL